MALPARGKSESEEPMWLALWLGHHAGFQDCVVVQAASIDDAAAIGAELLDAELRPKEVEIGKVQVWPLPEQGQWFDVDWRANATPSALQCCGGAPSSDGHSGYCPEHREDDA